MRDIDILVLNHLWLHNALFKPYISLHTWFSTDRERWLLQLYSVEEQRAYSVVIL